MKPTISDDDKVQAVLHLSQRIGRLQLIAVCAFAMAEAGIVALIVAVVR
jgi:hypothetical protein